jgi:hypothetical protein
VRGRIVVHFVVLAGEGVVDPLVRNQLVQGGQRRRRAGCPAKKSAPRQLSHLPGLKQNLV